MTSSTLASPRPATITMRRVAVLSVVAAVLDLLALWIGRGADASLTVAAAPYEINEVAVVMGSIVPLLVGALVVRALSARNPGARPLLGWVGFALALLSAASPFAMADDTATGWTLATMHVVVGVAWALVTTPWRPASPRR